MSAGCQILELKLLFAVVCLSCIFCAELGSFGSIDRISVLNCIREVEINCSVSLGKIVCISEVSPCEGNGLSVLAQAEGGKAFLEKRKPDFKKYPKLP